MGQTAEDLWPMVEKLSRRERVRLARMVLSSLALSETASDADRYRATPVHDGEFSDPMADPLAWDADGWDDGQKKSTSECAS